MALIVRKISDDLYHLSLTPPDVEEDWSPDRALSGHELVRVLLDGEYHLRDIYDALDEQDPKWSEKARGSYISPSDNPEISIPGVFPRQSRILGMANGGRCIPSIYLRLREIRLQLPVPSFERVQAEWRALGIKPPMFENELVQVVLMDWHVGEGTASAIANPNGNAELFFSDGGGFSGGSQRHPSICKAGVQASLAVRAALPFFVTATAIDLPKQGDVSFYAKSKGQLLSAIASEDELSAKSHALYPLWQAMMEIVDEYRLKFPMS
jgi:hypothetical protein